MEPIRVAVLGATGRMGSEIVRALGKEADLKLVVGIARRDGFLEGGVPLFSDIERAILETHPQVLVDFSTAEATRKAIAPSLTNRVSIVVGTSGLTSEDLKLIEKLGIENDVGAVVVPNFSIGAVVMMHLCRIAAKYFDHVEICERHHHQKLDSPSGTALATAQAMVKERGKPFLRSEARRENLPGTRGGEVGGVYIHSLRLPGSLAHQEVIFGATGQTLTIRHDALSRECYLPGILLAIREVVKIRGLVYGLERLLGL